MAGHQFRGNAGGQRSVRSQNRPVARPGQLAFEIDRKRRNVGVRGPFQTTTTAAVYSAVSAGLGIAYSPRWQIRHLLDAGQVD